MKDWFNDFSLTRSPPPLIYQCTYIMRKLKWTCRQTHIVFSTTATSTAAASPTTAIGPRFLAGSFTTWALVHLLLAIHTGLDILSPLKILLELSHKQDPIQDKSVEAIFEKTFVFLYALVLFLGHHCNINDKDFVTAVAASFGMIVMKKPCSRGLSVRTQAKTKTLCPCLVTHMSQHCWLQCNAVPLCEVGMVTFCVIVSFARGFFSYFKCVLK